MEQPKHQIAWQTPAGLLFAIEPRIADVTPHLPALVTAYNDPHNAPLLGHTAPIVESDVIAHYTALLDTGSRPFLLYRDGSFAGDADLRGIAGPVAEFAFLVADPDTQGKGLGTRFAIMIHAFAFARLGLERVYASVVPENVASRRAFEKVGYTADDGDAARAFGDPGDVTLSIDRGTFDRTHAAALTQIRITTR